MKIDLKSLMRQKLAVHAKIIVQKQLNEQLSETIDSDKIEMNGVK